MGVVAKGHKYRAIFHQPSSATYTFAAVLCEEPRPLNCGQVALLLTQMRIAS